MAYAVAAKHRRCDMIHVASLTAVGSKYEGVEAATFAPDVQGSHVGKQVINPVGVWWVLLGVPFFRGWVLPVQSSLDLALVVNTVKANHSLEEEVERRVARGVLGDFVERPEYVDDDLFIGIHLFVGFVHAEESGDLYQPSYIVGDQLVINDPCRELVPFVNGSAVDGDPPFNKLVLAGFQVGDDLLSEFSKVPSLDVIIGFQKDFPQP